MIQPILLLAKYPEFTLIQKNTYTTMFIAALFTIDRAWKEPKCPSTEEWIKKCGVNIQRNITQPL